MGQGEVFEVLKREKSATAEVIADKIGISVLAVRGSLNKMLKFHEVERIVIQTRHSNRCYVWKLNNNKEVTKENAKEIYSSRKGSV